MVFGAYLYKKSFSVVKDQQSSCWLTSHGDLSGLLARWTLHHEEDDITPSHKSGRKHRGDDCLSRAPVEPSLTVSDDDGDAFLRAVHDTIIRERHYSSSRNSSCVGSPREPSLRRSTSFLTIPTRLIRERRRSLQKELHRDRRKTWLPLVPGYLQEGGFHAGHNILIAGHLGGDAGGRSPEY